MITVLDDGPCACCERHPRGCTDGPSGPCCPCCNDTGREFWPYENQEAARVFAAATIATARLIEDLVGGMLASSPTRADAIRHARQLRGSVHIFGEVSP